jgi:hypothetical protein
MSGPVHTYGPTCHRSTPKQDLVALQSSPTPPDVDAQFFYISSLPIDDPLTPLPAATTSATARTTSAPQPFSARDTIALEQAWRALSETFPKEPGCRKDNSINPASIPRQPRSLGDTGGSAPGPSSGPSVGAGMHKKTASNGSFRPSTWPKKRDSSPLRGHFKSAKRNSTSSPGSEEQEIHTAGSDGGSSRVQDEANQDDNAKDRGFGEGDSDGDMKASPLNERVGKDAESLQEDLEDSSARYKIPVGVSRLHLVELPGLKVRYCLLDC